MKEYWKTQSYTLVQGYTKWDESGQSLPYPQLQHHIFLEAQETKRDNVSPELCFSSKHCVRFVQKHNQFEEYDVNKRQKWHLDSGSSILNTKIRKISVLKTLLLFNCANHRDKRPFVSTANEALVGTLMIYLPYNTKQTLLLKYIALPSHLSVHFCIPRTRLSKKSFVGFHMARTTSRDFVARGRPLRG